MKEKPRIIKIPETCDLCDFQEETTHEAYCCLHHRHGAHDNFKPEWCNVDYITIHDKRNLQKTCWCCHPGHRHKKLEIWDEIQFCKVMNIIPRSKIGMGVWKRNKEDKEGCR